MKNIQLQLPIVIKANDYHEFDATLDVLKQFGVNDVRYAEVGYDKWLGHYGAVFYTGTKRDAMKWFKEAHPNTYQNWKWNM